jgi:hypothetical protein
MQLLDQLKERKGWCKLKEGALDRALWIAHLGRDCGPVVRRTRELMSSRYSSVDGNTALVTCYFSVYVQGHCLHI